MAVGEVRGVSRLRCGAGWWSSVAGPSLGLLVGGAIVQREMRGQGGSLEKATDHSLCSRVPGVGSRMSRSRQGEEVWELPQ